MLSNLTKAQQTFLNWLTLGALFVILLLLSRFSGAIISACIAAFIFAPFYNWMFKKTKRGGLSLFLTVIFSFLVVFIPLAIVVWVSANQIQQIIGDISRLVSSGDIVVSGNTLLDRINNLLSHIGSGSLTITTTDVQNLIVKSVQGIGGFIVSIIKTSIGTIPGMITNIIIFMYVFTSLLPGYKPLLSFIRKVNPLGNTAHEVYMNQTSAMTLAMVKGQFVVAIVQGTLGACFLWLAGIHYFALFALLLSALSIVPLGGGLVTIPIGIFMLLTGNIAGGLFVLLTHFLVITNIDNFLRPRLVPKSVQLHPALVMISVLAGVSLFGFLGIVVGPVLFIIALTTVKMYITYSNNHKSEAAGDLQTAEASK